MFYTFSQNNSGGSFDEDVVTGISHYVVIEADSSDEANTRAESVGIYFDYEYEQDCECCGMRWYPASSYDGEDVPSVYGTPIVDFVPTIRWMAGPEGYVHYKDGTVRPFEN